MSELIIDREISRLYENAHAWCEKAVAKGHIGAHMLLARLYHEGLGVQPDPRQAVSLWMKAAQQGYSGAQFMIGMACETGLVLKEDRVAAMRFLSASAAQGNMAAKICLPSLRRKLTADERAEFAREPALFAHSDSADATNIPPPFLLWAAEAGDVESQNDLGAWYSDHMPETGRAHMWFTRAADQGDGNACHNLGSEAFNTGDMPLAAKWYRKAIAAGILQSFFYLGIILERDGDIAGAAEIFQRGADRNCPDCQCSLGRLAFLEGTNEAYERARYWDEKAAAQGNAASQVRLGTMHHEGLGGEPNADQAVHWWRQAAQQGHHVAQYKIGVAHHKGSGTTRDLPAAIRFLEASAASGNTDARSYLPQVEAELTPEEKLRLRPLGAGARHGRPPSRPSGR